LRFLIDNALPYHLATLLKVSSHDAVHVREYGMQKATDEEILTRAQIEKRTILSADTDFGTLLALKKAIYPPAFCFATLIWQKPRTIIRPSLLYAKLLRVKLKRDARLLFGRDVSASVGCHCFVPFPNFKESGLDFVFWLLPWVF